jgi:hypothetical protein
VLEVEGLLRQRMSVQHDEDGRRKAVVAACATPAAIGPTTGTNASASCSTPATTPTIRPASNVIPAPRSRFPAISVRDRRSAAAPYFCSSIITWVTTR